MVLCELERDDSARSFQASRSNEASSTGLVPPLRCMPEQRQGFAVVCIALPFLWLTRGRERIISFFCSL